MPVYIRGVGLTKVSEYWKKSIYDLVVEAGLEALDSSGIDPSEIDRIYVANALGQYINRQGHLGAYVADALGLLNTGAVRVEGTGASGSMAVYLGYKDLLAGAENILVLGVEKMTDVLPTHVYTARSLAEDWSYLTSIGTTFEGLEAILYRLYMKRYNVDQEKIAMLSVISHSHAEGVKHAQFPRKINLESVMRSPIIADPLHLLEIPAPCDGAAAVVLSKKGNVKIDAVEMSTDEFRVFEREDPLWLDAVHDSMKKALANAKLGINEIDFVELYDVSTILGVLELEAMGFADKGKGVELISEEMIGLNGKIPVNTFGGLKARGDPMGATAIYQIIEIYKQLIGEADRSQIDNAKIGLSLSLGGLGNTAVISILSRK
ncbi:MAG: thiolase C-terminal domain-containing protein [Candidatus Njordarchaeia archaeon]|nr:thiolase domain-containing protein [Candidatus Korarchaeota archaeon]